MTADDAEAVLGIMEAVWGEGNPIGLIRLRHLATSDPGGAWVSTDGDGTVDGAALALLREGIWGLSLLIVRPEQQSSGVGRELMARALAYADGSRGGIIISSEDPRALRTYWRAGFTLRPSFNAAGAVRVRPVRQPGVREGRWPADRDLVDAASRAVRTAAHGPDIDALLAAGRRLRVHDGGGFSVTSDKGVVLVAAPEEALARVLLLDALHELDSAQVDFIDARQEWAMDIVLEAGLELVPSGAVCVRGEVGPLRPYLPSGPYL